MYGITYGVPRYRYYSALKNEIEKIGSRMKYMRPEFIEAIAVSCEPDEA